MSQDKHRVRIDGRGVDPTAKDGPLQGPDRRKQQGHDRDIDGAQKVLPLHGMVVPHQSPPVRKTPPGQWIFSDFHGWLFFG